MNGGDNVKFKMVTGGDNYGRTFDMIFCGVDNIWYTLRIYLRVSGRVLTFFNTKDFPFDSPFWTLSIS